MKKLVFVSVLVASTVAATAMSCPVCGPKPHCGDHFCAQDNSVTNNMRLLQTGAVNASPLGTDPEPGVN